MRRDIVAAALQGIFPTPVIPLPEWRANSRQPAVHTLENRRIANKNSHDIHELIGIPETQEIALSSACAAA